MAQFVEPRYLGFGNSSLELLHGISADQDVSDVSKSGLEALLANISNTSTRGLLHYLGQLVANTHRELVGDGSLELLIGEVTDIPSSDLSVHTFDDERTRLVTGASIFALLRGLFIAQSLISNPEMISPSGGDAGPLIAYQALRALSTIGSALDAPKETPEDTTLIWDTPNAKFVVNRQGNSIWAVIKSILEKLGHLIIDGASLQERITQINHLIGQSDFPTDSLFRSQVRTTTMMGWMRYNYEHLSPLERRTFVTNVTNVRITSENIPFAIRFEPPSDFQSLLETSGPQCFVELDFNFNIVIPTGNAIPENWFLSLRIDSNKVDVVHIPTAQNMYTFNFEPTQYVGNEDVSIVMGLVDSTPATQFDTLVNVDVEWAVGGKIDSGSFPSHLLKDPNFGVQQEVVSDFIKGTVRPLSADFDDTEQSFLINTVQSVPILDTQRTVWFNTPLNGYSRDLQLNITYALNTTNGAYYIPTVMAFEFEFLDNEGIIQKTYTVIEGVKKYPGAGADPVQNRTTQRYIKGIDASVSLVRWTPKYYAWIDAFTPTTGRMQGPTDDARDTNRWDGSALTLTTGWSMPFTVDLTVISVEDSIGALRNARMISEEFQNNGVIFTPRSCTIVEAYQMMDKARTTTNLVNTFFNRDGILDWKGYRAGFMLHGWTKDVTADGQSLTNFGEADDKSVNTAGAYNVPGAQNQLSQLNPEIIGRFTVAVDGDNNAFRPPNFTNLSADIRWEDLFVLGTSINVIGRKYKVVVGYLDTGFSNIGDKQGTGMTRYGTAPKSFESTGLKTSLGNAAFQDQYNSLDRLLSSETQCVFYLAN